MGEIAQTIVGILGPYLGRVMADTCVRATALSIGKTSADLSAEDLPVLEANIKRMLSPVTSKATVDKIIADIEREVA